MVDTAALISERKKTHGDFTYHAMAAQGIKYFMKDFHIVDSASDVPVRAWEKLTVIQQESLDMIAHKIGRILAGDPDFRDHWDDIAGYAKLVADRCSK